MTTEARQQFEERFGPPGIDYDFKQDSSGMYYSRTVRRAWEIWEEAYKAGRLSGLQQAAEIANACRDVTAAHIAACIREKIAEQGGEAEQ